MLDHEEIVYDENGGPVRRPDRKVKKKQYFKAFTSTDPSPAGRRAVEKMASDWLSDRESGMQIQDLTVKEAIAKYIDLKKDILSPTTINGYRTLQRTAYDQISSLRIDRIKDTELQAWINQFSAKHAPKTTRNAWGLFTAVCDTYAPGKRFSVTLPMKKPAELYVQSDADMKKGNLQIKSMLTLIN